MKEKCRRKLDLFSFLLNPESLFKLFLSWHKPLSDLFLDCVSRICQRRRISGSWSAKINTMSAVLAIYVNSLHSRLCGLILDLSKTSILPRVFSCISKYNLIPSNVEAAVPLVIEVNSGWPDSVIEYILAPLKPVVGSEKL